MPAFVATLTIALDAHIREHDALTVVLKLEPAAPVMRPNQVGRVGIINPRGSLSSSAG